MELGLILTGFEAEEFLRNEKNSSFSPEQIAFSKMQNEFIGAWLRGRENSGL